MGFLSAFKSLVNYINLTVAEAVSEPVEGLEITCKELAFATFTDFNKLNDINKLRRLFVCQPYRLKFRLLQ